MKGARRKATRYLLTLCVKFVGDFGTTPLVTCVNVGVRQFEDVEGGDGGDDAAGELVLSHAIARGRLVDDL